MNLFAAAKIIVVIVSSDAEQPRASERAIRNILAEGVELDVRLRAKKPADADLAQGDAAAVGVIIWDAKRTHARIRLLRAPGTWIERGIEFSKDDLAQERGRAAGFALAAMFPSELIEPRRSAQPQNPNDPTNVTTNPASGAPRGTGSNATSPPAAGNTSSSSTSTTSQSPSSASGASPVPRQPAAVPPSAVVDRHEDPLGIPESPLAPPRFSLEAAGSAAFGIAGDAGSFGGIFSGRWYTKDGIGFGGSLAARWGSIDHAQSTSQTYGFMATASYRPWLADRHLSVGGRLGAGVLWQRLSHFSGDEATPLVGSRLLPAIGTMLEVAWRFGTGVGIQAAFGTEFAFGPTDVYVKGTRVSVLPVARGVGEVGICAFF